LLAAGDDDVAFGGVVAIAADDAGIAVVATDDASDPMAAEDLMVTVMRMVVTFLTVKSSLLMSLLSSVRISNQGL
jgi:hypothetical protein